MNRIVKRTGIVVSVLFVLLLIILAAGFFPLSHSSLQSEVVRMLKFAGADSCSVGSVVVTPYDQKIVLNDLTIFKKIDKTKQLTIALGKITLQVSYITLTKRYKDFQLILKDNMRHSVLLNDLLGRRTKSPIKKGELLSAIYNELNGPDTIVLSCINSIVFDHGTLSLDSLEIPLITSTGVSGALCLSHDSVSTIKLTCFLDTLHSYNLTALSTDVSLSIEGARCKITSVKSTVCDGSVDLTGMLDLAGNTILALDGTCNGADLSRLYALKQHHLGNLSGTCALKIHAQPGPAQIDLLQGTVGIVMTDVKADDLPVMTRIALLTRILGFQHIKFNQIRGDFTFAHKKITTDSLVGTGDPLSIAAKGWVRPDSGSFKFDVKAVLAAHYKDSIAPLIWNTLIPQPDSSRMLLCTVFGTEENPSVSLNKDIANRAINNVLQELGDKIKSFFQ